MFMYQPQTQHQTSSYMNPTYQGPSTIFVIRHGEKDKPPKANAASAAMSSAPPVANNSLSTQGFTRSSMLHEFFERATTMQYSNNALPTAIFASASRCDPETKYLADKLQVKAPKALRCIQTVDNVAQRWNVINIRQYYTKSFFKNRESELANYIFNSGMFKNQCVLIWYVTKAVQYCFYLYIEFNSCFASWPHKCIPQLLQCLRLPAQFIFKWPKDRYDLTVALRYNAQTGQILLASNDPIQQYQYCTIPQAILPQDSKYLPPFKPMKFA